jgi:diguanylate cyclase (GGDEF)-like protein
MESDLPATAALTAPTMLQLGQRVMAVITLFTAAIIGTWLWIAWNQVCDAQLGHMHTTVRLITAQSDHYFAALGIKLEKLMGELHGIDPAANPERARPHLQAFVAGSPDVVAAALVRPDGQMLVTTTPLPATAKLPNLLADARWQPDFKRDLGTTGLSISRPQQGYLHPVWVLHARYTVRDRNGRVRYLIQAGIPLDRQQALWSSLGLDDDSALGLLRDDAYLISRFPDTDRRAQVYGRQVLDGALFLATHKNPRGGKYEGTVVDGSHRIGVYRRLGTQPMYAFLSVDRKRFVALWWGEVRWPLALVVSFLLAGVLTYVAMARRYGDRMREIEERMAFADAAPTLPSSGVQEIDTLMAALAQSRDKLREAAHNREKLLLSAADAGTYVIRESDGCVLSADRSLLGMLGREEAEVIGCPWSGLVEGDAHRASNEAGAELARRIVRVTVPEQKSVRWLSVAEYREMLLDGDTVRNGLAIDVTDREDLLNQVNLQTQRLQALWQLATTRGKSDSEKMRLMLRLALDTLHMETVLVNERHENRLVVREAADDLRLFHSGQELAWQDAPCRRAIESETSVIIPDLRTDRELQHHTLVVHEGLRGFASIPIFAGNLLYGTLVFLRRAPLADDFSADDRAFMELLAAWFGQILLEERQRAELERLAMTDTLTRLTNRRAAEARFHEEFARARRANESFSVAVCDLDRFKLINDHYGHDVGDQVLLHIAEVLKGSLREGDWVARWGGEEFIIFLHHADSSPAFAAMERLRLSIKGNPVTTPHGPLAVTASIGLGTYRGQGDVAAVLSEADGCLFEAKRAGRDRVVMSESSRRGTLWRAGMLQHALLENRMVPAYQVIVDLRTREVVADEALARIVEPEGQIVPAGEFIEAAEGINLIHVVDETIVRHAMKRCVQDAGGGSAGPGFAHFVNLSAQFLSRREQVEVLLSQAATHCAETGLLKAPVKPLVLEITERQLIGDFDDLMRDLQPLVDFGFRLALDDFGSGYSSFLYLAKLPISFLKIEGWMVQNLRTQPRVLAMVQSIIRLARDQGIITIAEYVEDAATADLLTELGADWGQGWYFGKPQCEEAAVQTLLTARTGTA